MSERSYYSKVVDSAFGLIDDLFKEHYLNKKIRESADILVEKFILKKLRRTVKEFILISEESGIIKVGTNPKKTFFLDPIDGTGNFMKKIPIFAVSFACSPLQTGIIDMNKIDYSIIISSLGLKFEAIKGEGFFVNGVKTKKILKNSKDIRDCFIRISPIDSLSFKTFSNHIRLLGASSIELGMLASGVFDAFIDFGTLKLTDITAPYLILKEARITFSDAKGKSINFVHQSRSNRLSLVASSSKVLHRKILELLEGAKE